MNNHISLPRQPQLPNGLGKLWQPGDGAEVSNFRKRKALSKNPTLRIILAIHD